MTERLVAAQLARQGLGKSGKPGARPSQGNSPIVQNAVSDLESRLRDRLATHVTIHHGEKKGRIEIQYYGNDDLDRILSHTGSFGLVRSAGVDRTPETFARRKNDINVRSSVTRSGLVFQPVFHGASSCKPGDTSNTR